MAKITYDYSKAAPFVSAEEIENIKGQTLSARELLLSKKGAGNDFLGWVDLPVDYDKE
jgi:glucose-6-phosphate isomerase